MAHTIDQKRARFAWEHVEQAAKNGILADYTREAKGAPALIMNSGLMQTLAFLYAKEKREQRSKEQHSALLEHLCKWLIQFLPEPQPNQSPDLFKRIMNALHQSDSPTYMRATHEALALLRWIRQFADARKAMEKKA